MRWEVTKQWPSACWRVRGSGSCSVQEAGSCRAKGIEKIASENEGLEDVWRFSSVSLHWKAEESVDWGPQVTVAKDTFTQAEWNFSTVANFLFLSLLFHSVYTPVSWCHPLSLPSYMLIICGNQISQNCALLICKVFLIQLGWHITISGHLEFLLHLVIEVFHHPDEL